MFSRLFSITLLSLLLLKSYVKINKYRSPRWDFTHLHPMSLQKYFPIKMEHSAPLYAPSTASSKVSAKCTEVKTLPPSVLNVSPSSLVPAWKIRVSIPQPLGVSQDSPVPKPLSVTTIKCLSQVLYQH